MPKIKIYRDSIAGVHEEFAIHYTEAMRFHLKTFPEQVLTVVEKWLIDLRADTVQALEYKIRKIIEDYELRIKTKKKIIYTNICIGSESFLKYCAEDVEKTRGQGVSYRIKEGMRKFTSEHNSSDLDYGVTFEYAVGYVYETGTEKHFTVLRPGWAQGYNARENLDADGNQEYRTSDRSFFILDWTIERETYFADLAEKLDTIAKGFVDFFGNEKLMLGVMDNGFKLLPTGGTENA